VPCGPKASMHNRITPVLHSPTSFLIRFIVGSDGGDVLEAPGTQRNRRWELPIGESGQRGTDCQSFI
jgi:hypothetical protein